MMRLPAVIVTTLALVAVASAADPPTAEARAVAREHYEKAVNHFNAGEYVAAADEFLAVHDAVPQPALLYNAAQAYRLGGDGPKALERYREFVAAAPQAKQRPDVERRIKELERKTVVVKAAPDMSVPGKLVAPAKTTTTTAGTGGSDRLQAVADVVKQNRAGFRACFDKWSKSHPGVNGRVTLTFYLDPDGNLDEPTVDDKGFASAEVATCIEELSRTLRYPKSPSGKFTRFSYPFDFKAAR
ncbi:MAG: AgmX/PglI C-terminal domain-containing protein [Myxococcales bacterium]|nr:AgmX/PglI C-terminal domain-containing protein [Myxococcales bacterium]